MRLHSSRDAGHIYKTYSKECSRKICGSRHAGFADSSTGGGAVRELDRRWHCARARLADSVCLEWLGSPYRGEAWLTTAVPTSVSVARTTICLLYTSPSPRDGLL